jgi:UDP-glucose 4-epimerase
LSEICKANYLVTGAAGFIGAAVARKLRENGNKVVTVDNLSTGFRKAIPNGVEFIQGDCQDAQIIDRLSGVKFDAIFHIAGQSSGEVSYDDPVYDLQTNTQSTLLLLDLAKKTGCKIFVYASSMSVYGTQPDVPVTEDAVCFPQSFYAIGKFASEHYLRIYQQFGISAVSLRLFNVYGPGQNLANLRQGMLSIYLAQALKNRHILVKGSPDRYRDLVYIDDVVNAFSAAAEKDTASFCVYNVGTGVRTTVRELVEKIQKVLPFEVKVEFTGSTPGDLFGIYADVAKIKRDLNWSSERNLDEGLATMIAWASGIDF